MALILLTIFCAFSLQFSGCLILHTERNKTSFDVRLDERSEIKFYIQNSDEGKRKTIYVQHKALNKTSFSTKCIVSHWKESCNSTSDICRCLGDTSEGSAFSLNKIFLQNDSGNWIFQVWKHADASITVNVTVLDSASFSQWSVISTLALSHGVEGISQGSTEESDREKLSSNTTVSTAIIAISLIVIVIAITSVIAIWQCPKFLARNISHLSTNKGICFKTTHECVVDNEGEQLQRQERQSEQLLGQEPAKISYLETGKSSDEADVAASAATATTTTTNPTTTVTSASTFTAATVDGDDVYMNVSQHHLGSPPEQAPS